MRAGAAGIWVFGFLAVCAGRADQGHPRIYSSDATRSDLTAKIGNVEWAAGVYRRIKDEVEPYVDRHVTDPEWMVSRLQMHWKTRYAKTCVNGAVWSHGEGKAPVPTVRFAGQRDWNTDYLSPSLEEIQPYAEDERGMWLRHAGKDGQPWEWAPYQKTGHIPEKLNERILDLASKAAFLHWYTGEEKYAKFGADILWTYVEGMHHRENPTTYKDHSHARIIGLATFEVIHERITPALAVTYDYLYDYLVETGRPVDMAQHLFRRWADRIIEGGGARGNWNINQARYIVYLGLALEDNDAYTDGKGKQYYIAQFTTESSRNQTALKEVVPETYDPVNGVWPEAPGYAFSVTDTILGLAQVIHNASGQDVLAMYPIIVPAATVVSQFVFPSGFMVGFGDTYHELPYRQSMEMLLARFRRLGASDNELQVAQILKEQMELNGYRRDEAGTLLALTSYVDVWPEGVPDRPLRTRTFYADSVNFLAQRNAENAEHGLMISLAGTRGGHMQANGMAIELYGKGLVLGPDFGRGPSYWTQSHGEFYARFAAHNTVSVDGVSDYRMNKNDCLFKILAIEPEPGSYDALSDAFSFSETEFVEPKTDALQRRVLGIVKPSDTTGYYVDIFRSKRKDGKDRHHDYMYHNIGRDVRVTGTDGTALPMRPTGALGSHDGDHVGYNYFTNKLSTSWSDDFDAVFRTELVHGKDRCMGLWMMGQPGRTLLTAMSPPARTLNRGSAPKELWDTPVPTLIVRQDGAAWDRPFVAVFEPYYEGEGSALRRIRTLEPETPVGDFVGLAVETERNGTQYILNHTDDAAKNVCEGIAFAGTYGVIWEDAEGVTSLYLGRGRELMKDDMGIDGRGQVVSATLERSGEKYVYSANRDVTLKIKGATHRVPAAQRADITF